MKEYLDKRAVEHAVLHHSGDSAIVAVREIEATQVIPVEYIREYVRNASIAAERAKRRGDIYLEMQWRIKEEAMRELLFCYSFGNLEKDECCDYDE